MVTPELSIIIATYNDSSALGKTLASIERQRFDHPNWVQTLVIDGGSTDGTPELAEASSIVNIIVSEPDQGVYDAMNKGAALATGRWLHFLNAGDCFSGVHSLQLLMTYLSAPDTVALWAVARARNLGGGRREPVVIASVPHRWARHAWGLQPHCHQASWFRATVFAALHGHDLSVELVADFDLIMRFGMLERPIEIAEVLIDYEGSGMSFLRRRELPHRLHEVRKQRMDLGYSASWFDSVVTTGITLYHRLRALVGQLKGMARG